MSSGWLSVAGSPPSVAATSLGPSIRPSVRRNPDGEVRFVAGRAHRHGHRHRLLIWTGRADLQWRFARDAVGADFERLATHGHHGTGRDVAGRRNAGVVHARSVGPGAVGGASLVAPMSNALLDPASSPSWSPPVEPSSPRSTPTAGRRPVPICFIVDAVDPAHVRLLTPLDDKPKAVDDKRAPRPRPRHPRHARRSASWSSAGTRIGPASAGFASTAGPTLVEPGDVPSDAVPTSRDKYPQYATHALESSPMIAIDIEHATSWGALDAG